VSLSERELLPALSNRLAMLSFHLDLNQLNLAE
jgi:hypothetical protein